MPGLLTFMAAFSKLEMEIFNRLAEIVCSGVFDFSFILNLRLSVTLNIKKIEVEWQLK